MTSSELAPLRERRARMAAVRETQVVLEKADALYAPFSCPASAECCQLSTTRRQPWLWPSEWQLLVDHLAATDRTLPPARTDGGCPFLDESGKRCTVYSARPLGCRTYFCNRVIGPKREPMEPLQALSRRLEELNQRVDAEVSGPQELLELWAKAAAQSDNSARSPNPTG